MTTSVIGPSTYRHFTWGTLWTRVDWHNPAFVLSYYVHQKLLNLWLGPWQLTVQAR